MTPILLLVALLSSGSQWWILVQNHDGRTQPVPLAAGPYPSKEVCRLAGKAMMPDDQRFWTDAEKVDAKARAEQRERDVQAVIAAAWEKNKHQAGSVEFPQRTHGVALSLGDATRYHFDAAGKIVMVSGSVGYISGMLPPPSAITGCVLVASQSEDW